MFMCVCICVYVCVFVCMRTRPSLPLPNFTVSDFSVLDKSGILVLHQRNQEDGGGIDYTKKIQHVGALRVRSQLFNGFVLICCGKS